MPIEASVTQISDLDATYPANTDAKSQGAPSLRYVKTAVKSLLASGGSAQVGFIASGTGASTLTTQSKLRERISCLDFGADSTGTSDCSTAFGNAATAASGKTLRIPAGTYKFTVNTTLNCDLKFDRGAKLLAATGVTITIGGFIQAPIRQQIFDWAGTGAFSISSDRLVHARWFGAVPTGGTDNTAFVQKAVDSIGLGVVFFTAGTYEFHTAVSVAKSRIGFVGEGSESTILTKKSLTGNIFTFSPTDVTTTNIADFVIRDLCFQTATGDVHTNGAFITLLGCQRVRMRDCLLLNPFYGVIVRSSTSVDLYNVDSFSTGAASFTGQAHFLFDEDNTAVKRQPANVFVTNCHGRGPSGSYVMTYGFLVRASDGIWFNGCYAGANATADLGVLPLNADTQLTGLKVNNCWFDPVDTSGYGVRISGATSGLYGLMTFSDCTISGGLTGVSGVSISPTAGTTLYGVKINNNLFMYWASHGINVAGNGTVSVRGLTVTGNTFVECAETSGSNITLDDVKQFTVTGNTAGYQDDGTASGADYGLAIAAGCDEFAVTSNAFTGNTTGGVSDSSGGGANKSVANNVA
jgi:hypothetical protein